MKTNEQNQNEDENLNLDLSVLTDRGSSAVPLMDLYGLRVFDETVEKQILEYEYSGRQRLNYYGHQVFYARENKDEAELLFIKDHVFASATALNYKKTEVPPAAENRHDAVMYAIGAVFLFILIWNYRVMKKKARAKQSADVDNRYEE